MSADNSKPAPPHDYQSGDWVLQNFVGLINRTKLQVPVTLQLSGLTVSGTTIAGPEYFRKLGDLIAVGMQNGNVSSAAESMREYFSSHAKIYDGQTVGSEEPSVPATYIHLENAVFWGSDGRTINSQGALWRGRLSEVSGFYLGALVKS
ncbi:MULTISPECIES: gas vesicle accessory protein GvpU [Achromobacter]|uniref:gas vesicle accessory protein GvpU n=1 Tax=Achromobacter TaxID=222 RepID=UPI000A761023|nr:MULTISPECIES: gas vesicle accessory protein GvpU [Achromobacter]